MSYALTARRALVLALGLGLLVASCPGPAAGWRLRLPFRLPNTPQNDNSNDNSRYNTPPAMGPNGPLPNTYYDTHPAEVSEADKKACNAGIVQGNQFINEGRYQDATRPLLDAIQANPNSAVAYNDLGVAYMGLKQYPVAAQYLLEATRRDPGMALAYRNLGSAYDQTSARQAIPYYTKVLQLTPNDSQVWAWRGYDYAVCGDRSDAMFGLTRAIHLNPRYADAYHWRGVVELHVRQDKAAYADLRRSRMLNPSLGAAIAQDIRAATAQRQQEIAEQRAAARARAEEEHIASRMPEIRRIAREGPRYYEAIYREARRDGETEGEARAKEEAARATWDRDVALQNAWEHNDQETMSHIEAGDWSQEQIANYNADDHPETENNGEYNGENPAPASEPEPEPAPSEGGE